MNARVTSQWTKLRAHRGTKPVYVVAVQGVTQDSRVLGAHHKHIRSKLGRAKAARVSPALEILGSRSLCTWASKLVKLKLLSLT